MKRLYSSPDLIQASQLRDVLANEGIPCFIKNTALTGLAGEVPFTETFPEVWLENDSDLPRAQEIKADWSQKSAVSTGTWVCSNCGERLEGQFSSCWKCGTPRGENVANV